jgi:hypothetical protein
MNYLQQISEIEYMISQLPDTKKDVFIKRFNTAMSLKGSGHRIRLTGLHFLLRKELEQ